MIGSTRLSMHYLLAAVLLALGPLSACAADYELAGGKLSVKGSLTAGAGWRTVSQDTSLVANVNSSQVGITGTSLTPTTGRNQDDGNLNFNKGDPVSQVVNGYLSVEYTSGNYGGLVSAKAWYDYELAKASHPWGNIPSGYAPDAPLSDEGAQARSRFSGVALDNLYVRGRQPISDLPFEWVLGWQKLDWGNRYIVIGGLRDLNPIDIPSLTRPGVLQREQETRIPVPQIFARLGVAQSTAIEGFYQFHFERNAPNQCGTFYSGVDWYSDGCNAVTVGAGSDRTALATGSFLKRAQNVFPSDFGQWGAAITHTVDEWATKFGLYATQFHSRQGYSGVIKSGRTGAPPFIPGDPDGLNPQYFTEYPDNIHMFGLTYETKFKAGTAFGELTYRPNQPFQFNAADLLGATKMDRPEDVEANPVSQNVYVILTFNERRKPEDVDAANPRAGSRFGHIIEMIPPDGDHAAARFRWEILLKCGDPSVAAVGASFSSETTRNGWFGMPDNLAFDHQGRLWIATDGNSLKQTGRADGVWAIETEGPLRGTSRHFYRVPDGAEMCGPFFTPDDETLFVAFMASAELGCFKVLGWPMPARILDLHVEFRWRVNGTKPPLGVGG